MTTRRRTTLTFLLVTIAALTTGAACLLAQDTDKTQPKTEKTAAPKTTDGKTKEAGRDDDSGGVGAMFADVEKEVDAAAGKSVGFFASIMFYPVLTNSEVVYEADGAVTDLEQITKWLKEVEAAGYPLQDTNYVLSLPAGSLTKEQAADLKKALVARFKDSPVTPKPAISVAVREKEEGDSAGKTVFKVQRDGIPIVVLWLVAGATFFTLRMGFINLRGFKHAIMVTAGKYDSPESKGEVSHFQALTAALSATVGLGNIAGVAIAVGVGGPGATFWMIIAGLLGMTAKFTECTLGQKYREVRPDGRIMGGAMYYLSNGLKEIEFRRMGCSLRFLGIALAILFAVLCILASLGGGNAFQVNQSGNAVSASVLREDTAKLADLKKQIDAAEKAGDEDQVAALTQEREQLEGRIGTFTKSFKVIYGLVLAVLVAVVIIGGIRRIASTAEKIVPLMCAIYVTACLWILIKNIGFVPAALSKIISEAFTPQAGYGGFLGVLVLGFKRAAFSNEAGVGSAAIAHSAAKTAYPVREGIVALLEPFIDTIVVCTMTALVIVITGAYEDVANQPFIAADNGAAMTSAAMGQEIAWFPYVLSVAVILFAFSTMISWSYYGERCWAYLFGDKSSMVYRIIFVVFVFLGSITSATNVLALSDLMILGMAFPNVLGVVLLSGKVKRDLNEYWAKYKSGELEVKSKE